MLRAINTLPVMYYFSGGTPLAVLWEEIALGARNRTHSLWQLHVAYAGEEDNKTDYSISSIFD